VQQQPGLGFLRGADGDHDLAGGCELDSVGQQVHHHLTQAGHVADQGRGAVGGDVGKQVQPLVAGLGGHQFQRPFQQVLNIEGLVLKLQGARLDLGVVQHVIDDAEQRVTAGADGLQVVPLHRLEVYVEQQPGHPDHCVHRCADLVAHGGKEGGLGQRNWHHRAPRSRVSLPKPRSRCWSS